MPGRNPQDQAGEASPILLEREGRALLPSVSRAVRDSVYRPHRCPRAICVVGCCLRM